MLGREEYPVIDEDLFESLFSLAGNQLRPNLRISDAEQTALTEFMDTPLLKILDQDGLVSIGDYFILLDFSEKVAAVTKEPSKVQLLKTRKYNDTSIQLYSFEDELLTILFGNVHESGRRLTQVNLNMIFRGRIGGSEAGINAIPFEFRLTPINR